MVETSVNTVPNVPVTPSPEHLVELRNLVSGYRLSQAIYVMAKLGIADLLRDGPRGSDELAQATGTHAGNLFRVLRFLAGIGIVSEVTPRRFALTRLGAGLRSDVPGSHRAMTVMLLDDHEWRPWGQLLHTVRTGETAFEHVHGMGCWEYRTLHPETGAIFNAAMTSNVAVSGVAITDAYDFAGIGQLVDVGGGHGLLLATVLQSHLAMRGVLFDSSEVVAGANPVLEAMGVVDRCEIVAGDFFEAVPAGGDAYILRQIIHDWDDARATAILQNCRRAMAAMGRLLVVERAIGTDYRDALPELSLDVEMLVSVGGIQRTDEEYRLLFAAAGFRLTNIVPLGDAQKYNVFEGVPV